MSRLLQSSAGSLGLFATVSAALVTLVYVLTQSPIRAAEARWFQASLAAVLQPPDKAFEPLTLNEIIKLTDRTPCSDCWKETHLIDSVELIYRSDRTGVPVTFAIPSFSSRGYSGRVDVITGITLVGEQQTPTVVGVEISRHRETPGIGDRIESDKSTWLSQFRGQTLLSDLDALSGATISAHAVEEAVDKTLRFARANQGQLTTQSTP